MRCCRSSSPEWFSSWLTAAIDSCVKLSHGGPIASVSSLSLRRQPIAFLHSSIDHRPQSLFRNIRGHCHYQFCDACPLSCASAEAYKYMRCRRKKNLCHSLSSGIHAVTQKKKNLLHLFCEPSGIGYNGKTTTSAFSFFFSAHSLSRATQVLTAGHSLNSEIHTVVHKKNLLHLFCERSGIGYNGKTTTAFRFCLTVPLSRAT